MTKSKKKILIILTLLIFFIFSSISKNFITNKQSLEFNEKDQVQIKQSGFYDLTGSPIFIDDDDPSKNWSYTASHYAWCSGSGNWTDPYVIENVTIDGQGLDNCIEIKNSDAYFIIRNCSLYNSVSSLNAGIKLGNVDNGKIVSTNCSGNSDGINLWNSNNNTLLGNTASNNDYYGISLDGSNNNNLSGNTANNNRYGIYLSCSNNNNLSVNAASNNTLHGISLVYSNNNNLSGNIMNFCGISLSGLLAEVASHIIDNTNLVNNKPVYYYVNEIGLGSINFTGAGQIILINCNSSIISGLNLSNSTTGIYLGYSNNNTLSGNNASNNGLYGIYLGYSNNNMLSGNTAYNNSDGIYLEYSNNNNLSGNTACNNFDGISLEYSNNNTLLGNTANNYLRGISLRNSDNNTLLGNTASNNTLHGISLFYSNNNNLSVNIMNFCGISFSGSLAEVASHIIDDTNLVNNKPVYYYVNKLGLDSSNFTNAGQIFLINCNDSLILDLEFSNCSSGISLWNCFNNTIFNNTAFSLYYYGISVSNCNNISVSQNNVSNCIMSGIIIYNANHINLTKNYIDNCMQGIIAQDCNNTIISNNTMINNTAYALSSSSSQKTENITITGNIMNGSGINFGMSVYNIEETTYNIDKSNLVNGKIFYYYINEKSLTNNNFANAGQIFIYNCSDVSFSDLDLSHSSSGLTICNCNNLTVLNIDSSYNSWAGASIFNCNNSKFSELTIKNCTNFGLYLINCHDIIISNSTITDNYNAFYLSYCSNLTLAGNYLDNNADSITMQSCSNSTLINNTINNSKMIGSIIHYGGNALHLSGSSHNNFTGNKVLNSEKIGIQLNYNSNNNTFLRNIIANNSQYGIYIDSSGNNNNTFYINNFINNGISAEDNGDNNRWDDGDAGNYWDDYSEDDFNPIDGIGDTSYLILGTAGRSDFKPLVFRTYEDTDGDWLINYEEYILGDDNYRTNVTNPDSDYDGLTDYWEWRNSTNPQKSDTDSDNMPDLWEVTHSLNANFNDAMEDPDLDLLENIYEYLSGTNPHNDDTDSDTYLDGSEVSRGTDPLNEWWYPMPNLAVIDFRADNVTEGLPFVFDFTIINNGIWKAEGIIIIIRIDTLDLTLYNNTANPISLDEDESRHIFCEVSSLTSAGQFILNMTIDPGNLINETYSLKDGNLRESWNTDNSILYIFRIIPGGGDGGLDELLTWIIIGIILAVAFTASISFFLVVARPKLRRRNAAKRLIKSAKDDIRNFEISLQSFVKSRLNDNYKSIWWEEGIPEYIKKVVDNKINAIQPKKLDRTLDKIGFLDFTHYNAIITDQKNWEPIFSDIFSDKNVVETNLEGLSVFKRNLYDGKVTPEEMSNYTLFIYTISSYFAKGFNIFISYSTLDTDYFRVKEVAKRLESYPRINKVLFWEEDSQENIVGYMEKALQMSKVFVFFCSQKAVKSKAVADEWQAAFQMRKKGLLKIVPVYEKEVLIPNLLMPLLNVKYTKDDFDGFIQKLYDEILR